MRRHVVEILVRGRNCQVSKRLRSLAEEKVSKITRFARDVERVEVDFSEVHHRHEGAATECEITAHLKRHFVKAHVQAPEPEEALDLAVDKVEHQVSKIKERRVSRSHPRHRGQRGRDSSNGAGDPSAFEQDVDDEEASDGPSDGIVKTKRFTVKPMTTEEAVLQMELLGHAFFLFTNAEDGHAAVLYRRRDGALGLIEAVG
jgi:putative sigma-54 modulation protein